MAGAVVIDARQPAIGRPLPDVSILKALAQDCTPPPVCSASDLFLEYDVTAAPQLPSTMPASNPSADSTTTGSGTAAPDQPSSTSPHKQWTPPASSAAPAESARQPGARPPPGSALYAVQSRSSNSRPDVDSALLPASPAAAASPGSTGRPPIFPPAGSPTAAAESASRPAAATSPLNAAKAGSSGFPGFGRPLSALLDAGSAESGNLPGRTRLSDVASEGRPTPVMLAPPPATLHAFANSAPLSSPSPPGGSGSSAGADGPPAALNKCSSASEVRSSGSGGGRGRRRASSALTSVPRKPATSPFAAMSLEYFPTSKAGAEVVRVVAPPKEAPVVVEAKVERVTFPQAWEYCTSRDFTHRLEELNDLPAAASPGCFSLLCRGSGLLPVLEPQRRRVLALARVAFEEDEDYHWTLLLSVYAAYTGDTESRPTRVGPHWGALGFQGSDPASDLRGAGVLGLLHLHLLHHHHPANAAAMYLLSRRASGGFPLAIVSLNVTRWVLQLARQGQLAGPANRAGSMYEAANRTYVGAMYDFYNTWRREGGPAADSAAVLRSVETRVKKRPADMVKGAAQTLVG